MKKSILPLLLISALWTLSCLDSNKTNVKTDCNENIEFKNSFMSKISKVEEYTSGKGERSDFDNSLKFLSKYVKVSHEELMNYANEYTNLDVFSIDKNNWLKWYEENKCNNIRFK